MINLTAAPDGFDVASTPHILGIVSVLFLIAIIIAAWLRFSKKRGPKP